MSAKSSAISRKPRIFIVMLTGIILVAAALRLLLLGKESFNIDEIPSITFARYDWTMFWKIMSTEQGNMGLYYFLLHGWLHFGNDEQTIRVLSVLPAVATIPVIYALGRHLFDRRVGFVAALLLSANAFHIRYAQEARGYSLLVFLATLSSLFFARGVQQSSSKNWTGYSVTIVAAIFDHFFGALVFASHWASLPFLRPKDVPWRAVAVSSLMIGLFALPLGLFVLTRNVGQIDWVSPPRLRDILELFSALVGEGGKRLLFAYFIPCVIALWMATKAWRTSGASLDTWRYSFLLAWLFGPIIMALVISLWQPIFVNRYLIICLPPLTLLAAIGLSRFRHAWALTGALIVIIGLALVQVRVYYAYPQNEDLRGATDYVLSHAKPGDAILFYLPVLETHFAYYRERFRPATQGPGLLVVPDLKDVSPPDTVMRQVLKAMADQPGPASNRMWLFLSHDQVGARYADSIAIQDALSKKYASIEAQKFFEVRVLLYSMPRGD